MSDDERKYLADSYRQAAFNLLHAARRLQELTEEMRPTRIAVARTAVDDLTEARSILGTLPAVRAKTVLEKA